MLEAAMSESGSECSSADSDMEHPGIDASALFAGVQLPHMEEPIGHGTSGAKQSQERQSASPLLSHDALLRHALRISGIMTKIPAQTRLKCKSHFDAKLLHALLCNPSEVKRQAGLNRMEHRAGRHMLRRWYIAASGLSHQRGDIAATKLWGTLTVSQKHHWVIVHRACQQLGSNDVMKCSARKLGEVIAEVADGPSTETAAAESGPRLAVVGILLTYHSKLGHDDPQVGTWIQQGLKGDELREKLQSKPAYGTYFDDFVAFVKELRDQHGFSSCCACMEMGDHARFAASVHLHAYVGFLQRDGGIGGIHPVSLSLASLTFCNMKPHYVATRGFKGRRLQDAISQGMYYVCGPKLTNVMRFTDLEPVEVRVDNQRQVEANNAFRVWFWLGSEKIFQLARKCVTRRQFAFMELEPVPP